jgi:acyl-CoA reductase-like NAD-dependent aldehyde dehydrogenase
MSLELGGKSPLIVCADADLEGVGSAIAAQYFHAGQICAAGTRILVEESIADPLMKIVLERIKGLKVGDPRDPETDVGPLITRQHLERVHDMVGRSRDAGATVLCGGDLVGSSGLYYQPTLITGLHCDMEIWQREIFGPVLVWDTFDTDEEAVTKANSTQYGLAAHVWGGSLERIEDFAKKLVAGTVWLNCSNLVVDVSVPFGGARSSGIGREGGLWSIEFFADVKNVAQSTGDGTSALLRDAG